MAHTPGPWTVEDFSRQPQILAGKNCERTLAEVYTHGDKERFMSDARLMAAAPDLLAAIRVGLEWSEDDGYPDDHVMVSDAERAFRQAARAAIAKAEGGTGDQ